MAYYRLEPFGEMVADQRHGMATSVLANINRDPKLRPEPYLAQDFIPWHPVHSEPKADEGEFHPDPEQQSRRIKEALFKHAGSVA